MGPLKGFTVIELAGLGPAPMAGMMLADMGATVIRIERSHKRDPLHKQDASYRGKKSVVLDLKSDDGKEALLTILKKADVLIEGFRPGVTEKMGLGPDECLAVNPRLVYGRITGWGQEGPLSLTAGHDINYIALSGGLFATGRPGEKPAIPANALADGTGGMLLVNGVLAALLESSRSGQGQVVDAAMIDSSALCLWMLHGFHAIGTWQASEKGVNMLDGGAHFYDCYATSDDKFVAVGAIEPQFYQELLEKTGLAEQELPAQMNPKNWPALKTKLAAIFIQKTQTQWCEIFRGSDACFAPILNFDEAPEHPHHKARNSYIELDGFTQPGPAPRFSRTQNEIQHGQRKVGEDTEQILLQMGVRETLIKRIIPTPD